VALGFKENLFHFYFGLNSSLNFENSYLCSAPKIMKPVLLDSYF
jgi:hypothetical protein